MPVETKRLIESLELLAPLELQAENDNSGWQIDLGRHDISRILVALEITPDVINEAKGKGADLIITHHPLLYNPLGKVDVNAPDTSGAFLAVLISAGISLYSAHTSFDAAQWGMNYELARAFGLADVRGFPEPKRGEPAMGRKGILANPQPLGALVAHAEHIFGMPGRLRYIGDSATMIESIAICGGGAGEYVTSAIEEGVDLYITSDVKHHEAQWAKARDLALIDGGHWGTEWHFAPVVAAYLRKLFYRDAEVYASEVSADPFDS